VQTTSVKTVKTGCWGWGGLRFGRSGVCRGGRAGSRDPLLAAWTLQCAA